MGDHAAVQVRDRAASVGGEQEWQQGVNQASEAGFDQRKAERRGHADAFDIGFAAAVQSIPEIVEAYRMSGEIATCYASSSPTSPVTTLYTAS